MFALTSFLTVLILLVITTLFICFYLVLLDRAIEGTEKEIKKSSNKISLRNEIIEIRKRSIGVLKALASLSLIVVIMSAVYAWLDDSISTWPLIALIMLIVLTGALFLRALLKLEEVKLMLILDISIVLMECQLEFGYPYVCGYENKELLDKLTKKPTQKSAK
jgi:hypothetical protein